MFSFSQVKFNPYNWYWLMADGTTLFSSAASARIPTSDAGYQAWIAQGFVATPWPRDSTSTETDAALQAVLAEYNIYCTLNYYSANARYNKASGGCIITGKPFLSDPVSRNTLDSANSYAVANPGHITDWKLADGTFIPMAQADLANALQLMATFVQACFTCESNTATSISGGTITTHAQIDAAYAAISNVLS
jgi:hypothetical protein